MIAYKEPVLENEPKSFAHDPGRKKREDMTNIQSMISLSQTEWKVTSFSSFKLTRILILIFNNLSIIKGNH